MLHASDTARWHAKYTELVLEKLLFTLYSTVDYRDTRATSKAYTAVFVLYYKGGNISIFGQAKKRKKKRNL